MPDSPTEDLSVSQEADGQPDVSSTESSTEEKGSEQKSVLDAVQAGLDGLENSPASETQDSPADPDVIAEPEKAPPEEFSPDEIKRFHPKTQDRIRQILDQRDHANSIVKEVEPKVLAHDKIVEFMGRHQLGPADFDNGMAIMAEIKSGDPKAALEKLVPVVKGLMKAAGLELPGDLQSEVEANMLSEARARELSMTRAQTERLQAQRLAEAQRAEQMQHRQAVETVVNTAVQSVDQWYQEKAAKDPDWNLKQGRVAQLVELELRRDVRRYPRSAKEARDLCDRVLQHVEGEMKPFLPKPRDIRPHTPGSAPSRLSAKPKTALEAVNFGLAMTRS